MRYVTTDWYAADSWQLFSNWICFHCFHIEWLRVVLNSALLLVVIIVTWLSDIVFCPLSHIPCIHYSLESAYRHPCTIYRGVYYPMMYNQICCFLQRSLASSAGWFHCMTYRKWQLKAGPHIPCHQFTTHYITVPAPSSPTAWGNPVHPIMTSPTVALSCARHRPNLDDVIVCGRC